MRAEKIKYHISSEKDPRWNTEGDGVVRKGICEEALLKVKELGLKYKNVPDDLYIEYEFQE